MLDFNDTTHVHMAVIKPITKHTVSAVAGTPIYKGIVVEIIATTVTTQPQVVLVTHVHILATMAVQSATIALTVSAKAPKRTVLTFVRVLFAISVLSIFQVQQRAMHPPTAEAITHAGIALRIKSVSLRRVHANHAVEAVITMGSTTSMVPSFVQVTIVVVATMDVSLFCATQDIAVDFVDMAVTHKIKEPTVDVTVAEQQDNATATQIVQRHVS